MILFAGFVVAEKGSTSLSYASVPYACGSVVGASATGSGVLLAGAEVGSVAISGSPAVTSVEAGSVVGVGVGSVVGSTTGAVTSSTGVSVVVGTEAGVSVVSGSLAGTSL
jgi:hypothetical protein